ncbi:MAG: sugar ABC transporter permease [Christensenellaceae bacterium]|nr:sugar ABC transporter permease [Christensenellaceae bacterium]
MAKFQRSLSARQRTKARYGVIFVLPAFLLATVFMIYPLFASLYLSLTKYNFAFDTKPQFIGMENYVKAFQDSAFIDSIGVTAVYSVLYFVLVMLGGLILALMLFYAKGKTSVFRTAYFLPIVIPLSLSSFIFNWILQKNYGLLNYFLADILGVGSLTREWLSTNPWAMISIVVVSVWATVGFETILFLNGLQALPEDMLEAGIVDGATGFRTLFSIILPNLRETFAVTGIWAILQALKVYIVPSLVTWGGPGTATTVMYMYVYRQSFTYLEMGYGAALGFIMSILIMALSLLNMRISKKV